ncbi:MAG TPA: D-tyrosyl-tRNA(Tyr) deacylase [Nitrospirae bacterium]|nr:D-tyrosyl-tRNA(Tyr) deacylase [Nitrospirota bacterium]
MRALIQRVSSASVDVGGKRVSGIGRGLLILLGVMKGDTDDDLKYILRKAANLRIFEDDAGRMNLSVLDTKGEALVVSQFTLAADTRKGNRPSFVSAEAPERAESVYEKFMMELAALGIKVRGGSFGAMMDVSLVNDGPVTILLDSRQP